MIPGALLGVGNREGGRAKDASHVPARSGRKMSGTVRGIFWKLSLSAKKYSNRGTAEAWEPSAKVVDELMPVARVAVRPTPMDRTVTFPEEDVVL
jgi:hypothetical protein